jgi:hypothetical protein
VHSLIERHRPITSTCLFEVACFGTVSRLMLTIQKDSRDLIKQEEKKGLDREGRTETLHNMQSNPKKTRVRTRGGMEGHARTGSFVAQLRQARLCAKINLLLDFIPCSRYVGD